MKRTLAAAMSLALALATIPGEAWGQGGNIVRPAATAGPTPLWKVSLTIPAAPTSFAAQIRLPPANFTVTPRLVAAIAKAPAALIPLAAAQAALAAPRADPERALRGLFAEGESSFTAPDAPLPDPPQEPKAPKSRPEFLSRARGALSSAVRVLPDPERNRAYWNFTWGQALVTLGFYFQYTALPGMLAPTKSENQQIGYNRAVNWGSQAASSLLTGGTVDSQPSGRLLTLTYLGRGALMALVPVLYATGHYVPAALSLLVGLAGFLQSTGGVAGSVAWNRILQGHEEHYNRANAVFTVVTNVVGVVGPLLAGAFMAWAGKYFAAPLMGNALSFGVFGATLLAAGVGYQLFLKIPKDSALEARKRLHSLLKESRETHDVKKVTVGRLPDGTTGLFVEVAGDPKDAAGLPAQFDGFAVKATGKRQPVRDLIGGFRLLFSDRFLRLYLLLTTLAFASGDSLVFAAMPRYLTDVLKAGPGAFGILLAASSLGLGIASAAMAFLKDPAQAALSRQAKYFSAAAAKVLGSASPAALVRAEAALRLALSTVLERYKAEWRADASLSRSVENLSVDILKEAAVGTAAALEITPATAAALLESTGAAVDVRLWAASRGAKFLADARRDGRTGMDVLQRQGRAAFVLYAASWLVYAGLFFAPSLWASAGFMLLSALLGGPQMILLSSLTTKVISSAFPNDQGKVYSAMNFYMLACMVVGVLGFSWLLTVVATPAALAITAGVLVACSLFDVALALWGFPLRKL
jgi:hypothetical protein